MFILLVIRANTNSPSPWAKSDTEKTNLFASHLTEVFKPHDDTPDPEIIRKLAIHAPSSEKTTSIHYRRT
jgi:hypothetical protein